MDIRNLTPDDTDEMLQLCAMAGWNQTSADIRRLLELEPNGCFAARETDRLIGTVTTTTFGLKLAWVGMVLVHPEFRQRGIATTLIRRALDYLRMRGVSTIRLDATPAGRPLYERQGFVPEGNLERWSGEFAQVRVPTTVGGTWENISELDSAVFGADRSALLRSVLADSPYPLFLSRNESGELSGYAFARAGSRAVYIGPLIAADLTVARELLLTALGGVGQGTIFIDVNMNFEGAADLLRSLGFSRQRDLLRMRIGPDSVAELASRVFAIAGPEVG